MSNKWLMALFVVGAVAVGTVALKNNSKELVSTETPAATDVAANEIVAVEEIQSLETEATAEVAK